MSLDIDSPFWKFSLQVYSAPGVAAECLALQDRLGLDVNVLLFAAWLGIVHGAALDAAGMDRIERAILDWSKDVVVPLRAVRKQLKVMPQIDHADVQVLRKRVADTELFSEQLEQALLYQLADSFRTAVTGASEATLRANLAAVLRTPNVEPNGVQLPCLIAAACAIG